MSWAVSASIVSVIFAMWPCCIEDANHIDRALGHAIGQFLDRDRLRDRHFADDLFLRLAVAVAGHALDAATEGSDRAFAYLVGGKGGDDGEPAATLFGAAAGRLGRWRRPRRRAAAADAARGLFLVGFECRACAWLCCHRLRAEALLGDFVGLALGFFIVLAALFLVAFARFRFRPLGALGFFADLANAGFFLGDLAFFRLAQTRIGERVSARAALLVGERAQHNAARFGRKGSTGGRRHWRPPDLCRA